jgi:hypothetical protein
MQYPVQAGSWSTAPPEIDGRGRLGTDRRNHWRAQRSTRVGSLPAGTSRRGAIPDASRELASRQTRRSRSPMQIGGSGQRRNRRINDPPGLRNCQDDAPETPVSGVFVSGVIFRAGRYGALARPPTLPSHTFGAKVFKKGHFGVDLWKYTGCTKAGALTFVLAELPDIESDSSPDQLDWIALQLLVACKDWQ